MTAKIDHGNYSRNAGRANLSSAAGLLVQALVQNSLNLEAVEEALRDQKGNYFREIFNRINVMAKDP